MRSRPATRGCRTLFALLALSACEASTPALEDAPAASASTAPKPPAATAGIKVELEEKAMGTRVTFVAYTTDRVNEAGVRGAMLAAMKEIERLEQLMSSWRDDSEVSRINRAAGKPVRVGAETFAVIDKSLWASRISGGTFDVTFEALGDLWKFGDAQDAEPKPPSDAAVAARRALVDYRVVELDAATSTVRLPEGRRIGLGGIAKGYIVDRAAGVLRRAGLSSFLVQAGGDLYGAGRKPDGAAWVSGIQDPRGPPGRYFATLELDDHAFSTAGDYARSYFHAGKRYHHIIDPRTGYPATASRSVTVWAPNAFLADAVDDAVFILGPERGLELVESLEGVGAVIVDAENQVRVSKRLEGRVRQSRDPSPGP